MVPGLKPDQKDTIIIDTAGDRSRSILRWSLVDDEDPVLAARWDVVVAGVLDRFRL